MKMNFDTKNISCFCVFSKVEGKTIVVEITTMNIFKRALIAWELLFNKDYQVKVVGDIIFFMKYQYTIKEMYEKLHKTVINSKNKRKR